MNTSISFTNYEVIVSNAKFVGEENTQPIIRGSLVLGLYLYCVFGFCFAHFFDVDHRIFCLGCLANLIPEEGYPIGKNAELPG